MFALRQIVKISDPDPLGDVTLVPAMNGLPESEIAGKMAAALRDAAPSSGAEALGLLRRIFPDSPLTARVAALDAIMRR